MASNELSERERNIVRLLARGPTKKEICNLIGLTYEGVYKALERPRVAAAMRRELERVLTTEAAPEALSTLREIMRDARAPAAARVTAARAILERAGLGTSTDAGTGQQATDAATLRQLLSQVDGTLELVERRATVRLDDGRDQADADDRTQSPALDSPQTVDPFG